MTSLAWSSRIASSARCLRPPSATALVAVANLERTEHAELERSLHRPKLAGN